MTNPTCPIGICDGLGITFTQSLEQGGHADADQVALCSACGPQRFGGYGREYLAQRLATRLLEALPEEDLDKNRRAWTQVVACYGDDPDAPIEVGIREDLAEASMYGHEHTPEGGHFTTFVVAHERGPRWPEPWRAMLDLGDAVRVLLDARVGDANSRRVLAGPLRESAQTILDAAEHLHATMIELQVPDLRDPALLRRAQADDVATGLFVGLVKIAEQVAEAYAAGSDSSSMDGAVDSLLLGLRENLEDRFDL